jgi:uncharacterized protein YycO
MKNSEFNEKVKTQITATVQLTVTAFTTGNGGPGALRELLKKLEEALVQVDPTSVKDWYRWADIWVTDLQLGDIKAPKVLPVAKLPEEPVEAEVAE